MDNILKRYSEAKESSAESLNCISALFYLLGFDVKEIPHNMDDIKAILKECKQVKSSEEADMVYIPFPTEHFMVLDPSDKNYILHRNGPNQPLIREPLDNVISSIHPGTDGEKCYVFYKIEHSQTMETIIDKQKFIEQHVDVVSEKYKAVCDIYFKATNSGKEEDYQAYSEAQLDLEKIYTNKEDFHQIQQFRETPISDPLLKRQIDLLFLAYQKNQIDEKQLAEVLTLESKIENMFSTFRAEIDGKQCTDNQIEDILSHSTDSEEVKHARIASKRIGNLVAKDVIQIVTMRNDIAKSLGYDNYHTMSLQLSEQDPEEISRIFDELDTLTRDAFLKEKANIDEYLSQKFGIEKTALMPRHYQNRYFQEAPQIYQVDLDTYYKEQDVVELARSYYASLQLPVEDILAASDLYERPGKYQHAYCISDKLGTVRILCNIKPDAKWMNTTLHELGHGVYDKYIGQDLPYLLSDPAHTFTTEAIAMMFGRFASHPQRIQDMLHISDEEKANIADGCLKTLRLEQLVISRRMQVMYRFEKSMYADPNQDLNTLRRNLVEKYQMMKRPEGRNEPDRASKIHIACYPCYYHNYQLGELLASQLYYHIAKNVLNTSDVHAQSFFNKPEVGEYLKKNIFTPGCKYRWDTMIELATGEGLSPKRYAKQFVE